MQFTKDHGRLRCTPAYAAAAVSLTALSADRDIALGREAEQGSFGKQCRKRIPAETCSAGASTDGSTMDCSMVHLLLCIGMLHGAGSLLWTCSQQKMAKVLLVRKAGTEGQAQQGWVLGRGSDDASSDGKSC